MQSSLEIIIIAIWAYLFCGPLSSAKGIFSFMPLISNRLASLGKYNAIQNWDPNYFQKAILAWGYKCAECHAGIIMAIYYPIFYSYKPSEHFALTVLTIFLAHILTKVINDE